MWAVGCLREPCKFLLTENFGIFTSIFASYLAALDLSCDLQNLQSGCGMRDLSLQQANSWLQSVGSRSPIQGGIWATPALEPRALNTGPAGSPEIVFLRRRAVALVPLLSI